MLPVTVTLQLSAGRFWCHCAAPQAFPYHPPTRKERKRAAEFVDGPSCKGHQGLIWCRCGERSHPESCWCLMFQDWTTRRKNPGGRVLCNRMGVYNISCSERNRPDCTARARDLTPRPNLSEQALRNHTMKFTSREPPPITLIHISIIFLYFPITFFFFYLGSY